MAVGTGVAVIDRFDRRSGERQPSSVVVHHAPIIVALISLLGCDPGLTDGVEAINQTDVTDDTAGDDGAPGSNADAFVAQVDTGSFAFNFGPDGPHATTPFAASYDSGLGTATQSSSLGVTTFTSAAWTLISAMA